MWVAIARCVSPRLSAHRALGIPPKATIGARKEN